MRFLLFLIYPRQTSVLEQPPNFYQKILSLVGVNPIRGSDGKIYSDITRLNAASCLTRRFIQPVDIPNNRGNM